VADAGQSVKIPCSDMDAMDPDRRDQRLVFPHTGLPPVGCVHVWPNDHPRCLFLQTFDDMGREGVKRGSWPPRSGVSHVRGDGFVAQLLPCALKHSYRPLFFPIVLHTRSRMHSLRRLMVVGGMLGGVRGAVIAPTITPAPTSDHVDLLVDRQESPDA